MNRLSKVAFAAIVLPLALWAQTSSNSPVHIDAGEAKDYIGKNTTVTGRVAEVHISEKVVRLNFDKPFPRQPFTAVIFSSRTNYFGDLTRFKNAQAEVTGTIADYRGRPEVILHSTNQLVIVTTKSKEN